MSKPAEKKTRQKVPKKLAHSNFLLTINTQRVYDEGTPQLTEDRALFEKIIEKFLHNIENYLKIKEDGVSFSKKYFEDIRADYVVELGTKQRRLHTHIMLMIAHRTKIHLDENAIREYFKKELNVDSLYYNRKVFYSSEQNIQDYLKKQFGV